MQTLCSSRHASRFVALFTASTLAAAAIFQPTAAHADKSKNLKYGAIGLGVLGAVLAVKGKKLPAAAAVAGGLYAYQKGREAKEDRYDERYDHRRGGNRYPGSNYGGGYQNGGYSNSYPGNSQNGGYSNGGYSNAPTYPEYRANASQTDRGRGHNRQNRGGGYDLSPYLR